MRIKKFKNNEYVFCDGIWVRNFCKAGTPLDINSISSEDVNKLLENELTNARISGLQLDDLNSTEMRNLIIMSDGHGWKKNQLILGGIPNSLTKTIGVNGSLAKWEMVGEKSEIQRTMTFYLVNNPYPECMGYLPRSHRYYPNLIASTRTNPEFFGEYKSLPFFYRPSKNMNYYCSANDQTLMNLDDYRNPICAATSFAWKKGVKNLVLFCCDESFEEKRPGSIRMENGLYQYPQQIMCQNVIDGQLYWLRKAGVRVADCSSGIKYKNAEYIEIDQIKDFLENE